MVHSKAYRIWKLFVGCVECASTTRRARGDEAKSVFPVFFACVVLWPVSCRRHASRCIRKACSHRLLACEFDACPMRCQRVPRQTTANLCSPWLCHKLSPPFSFSPSTLMRKSYRGILPDSLSPSHSTHSNPPPSDRFFQKNTFFSCFSSIITTTRPSYSKSRR
jgi:hypothetical protein